MSSTLGSDMSLVHTSADVSSSSSSATSLSSLASKVVVNVTPLYGGITAAEKIVGGSSSSSTQNVQQLQQPRHVCSILNIGDARILLDCGWTEEFSLADIAPLRTLMQEGEVPGVPKRSTNNESDLASSSSSSSSSSSPSRPSRPPFDAVLISQSDLAHSGALPYLYGPLQCKAPIYMTLPVLRMAPLALYDAYLANTEGASSSTTTSTSSQQNVPSQNNSSPPFAMEDIKNAFDTAEYGGRVIPLRYLEEAYIQSSFIAISPSNSGYILGGSCWRIQKGTETIIYAPLFHHRNELHLGRSNLSGICRSPSAIITSSMAGSDNTSSSSGSRGGGSSKSSTFVAGSIDSMRELAQACLRSLRIGGHVLIPTDSAGRALEVLLRLDTALSSGGHHHHHHHHGGSGYANNAASAAVTLSQYHFPIYFLSHVAQNVLDAANTNVEYMSESIIREFGEKRKAPFEFIPPPKGTSRIRSTTSIAEVLAASKVSPCVVVTSFPSLMSGHARTLFTTWANDPKNTVLFTSVDNVYPSSIGGQLLSAFTATPPLPPPSSVTVDTYITVPLTGIELKRHREAKDEEQVKAARAVATARMRFDEESELLVAPSSRSSSSSSAGGILLTGAGGSSLMRSPSGGSTSSTSLRASSSMEEVLITSSSSGAAAKTHIVVTSPSAENATSSTMDTTNSNNNNIFINASSSGSSSSSSHSTELASAAEAEAEEEAVNENVYTDDEETIARLDFADDATSYSLGKTLPSSSTSASHRASKKSKKNTMEQSIQKYLSALRTGGSGLFPMYTKDDSNMSEAAIRNITRIVASAAAAAAAASSSSSSASSLTGGDDASDTSSAAKAAAAMEKLARVQSFRSRWTDYGNTISLIEFEEPEEEKVAAGSGLAHGTMLPVTGNVPSNITAQVGGGAGGASAATDADIIPTKRVKTTTVISVSCSVRYLPFPGRADAASIVHVLEDTAPLKLVFIQGSYEAATTLANMARRFTRAVYMPTIGTTIELSSNTSELSLRVSGSFFASLRLQSLGAHEIGFATADIFAVRDLSAVSGSSSSSSLSLGNIMGPARINQHGVAEGLTLIHPMTSTTGGGGGRGTKRSSSSLEKNEAENETEEGDENGHSAVFLRPGAVRAAEIRSRLKNAGVECKVIDGVVVTNGGILIRRLGAPVAAVVEESSSSGGAGGGDDIDESTATSTSSSGFGLEIEGPAIPEYYTVRRALYDLYTMV